MKTLDGIILSEVPPRRGWTGLFLGLPKRGRLPHLGLTPYREGLRFETADEVRDGCYELR